MAAEGTSPGGVEISARKRLGRWFLLAVVLATVGCDQVTKHVASTTLAGEPRQSYLGDTFRLELIQNPGAFLGLGADLPESVRSVLFSAGTALLLAVVAIVALRRRWEGRALLGLTLVWAGGSSNLVDRVTSGSVTDFMNLGIGWLRTGIFNVADVAIMLGIALVATSGCIPNDSLAPPEERS
jgi:signal peptidase II